MTLARLLARFSTFSLPIVAALGPPAAPAAEPKTEAPSRILFGSCAREDEPMPIFDTIVKRQPDLFLFLGDNVYADTDDMEKMRASYETLGADEGFRRLRESCPVLATWDDHDYGLNDAGADYPKRAEAEEVFLDFWGAGEDSPRRRRPGVYQARTFGPEGRRMQVILLDTRYFRGPLKTGDRRVGGPYYPSDDEEVTMLGEAQWRWLERQLRRPADLRIVGSSIQLVAEAAGQETWSNLPRERRRFFDLVEETGATGVLVVSGDRHWSELSVATESASFPIYDLTSSSFNQVHPRGTPTENRHRALPTTYHRENFGEILVDWSEPDPIIEMRILDLEGSVKLEKRLSSSELRPDE